MKVHRFIYFMLVVFLLSTISACTSKLPKDVEDILVNHYSYTTYSIVSSIRKHLIQRIILSFCWNLQNQRRSMVYCCTKHQNTDILGSLHTV